MPQPCRALIRRYFYAALLLSPVADARANPRVLVIGMDGVGGNYLPAATTPNLDLLLQKGGGSFSFFNEGALATSPPAGYGASGVNWSTIVTGASAAHHGVQDNSFSGSRYDAYPHFFKYLKDQTPDLYCASIVNWAPINDEILPAPYADLEIGGVSDDAVRDAAVQLLSTGDPDAIFLHFDQGDHAGHASGWGSGEYLQAIANIDRLIGDVVAAAESRPGAATGDEDWLILVTADHGGTGYSHFASQGPINWEVPFIVSGNSVPDGAPIGQGTLRDVATTALWHMGVDPFTTSVDGQIRGLPIVPDNGVVGDLNQDGLVRGDGSGPVETDDVAAFVRGWMTSGSQTAAEAYSRGDLNLDGITDLADWIVLNRLDPVLGASVQSALNRVAPEPSSGLGALLFATTAAWRRRRGVARHSTLRKPLRGASCRLAAAWVLGLAALCASSAYGALGDNLIAFYPFENNLHDAADSPVASDGAAFGGPQFAPGKIGQGLWLPGTGDYVALPSHTGGELDFGSSLGGAASDFTMAMWIRQDDFASDPAVLSNKDWSNGSNVGVNWSVKGNGVFDLNTRGDQGVRRDLDTAANSAPLAVGDWNLVVTTFDRQGPTQLYINGRLTGTIPVTSAGSFSSGLPWTIGQDGSGAYGIDFNGAVDELAVWSRALGAADVEALWNGGAGVDLRELNFDDRLRLIIDRDTGAMQIVNHTGSPQTLLGYQLTSASGSFNAGAWTPVSGRLDVAGDHSLDADDGWLVVSSRTSASDLSELSLGEGVLPAGSAIDLGEGVWLPNIEESSDVRFAYASDSSPFPWQGLVEFRGNEGESFRYLDLNFDGVIDSDDYATFLAQYSSSLEGASPSERYRRGDLNNDQRHSVDDFIIFKQFFDAAREDALPAISNFTLSLPEPTTACLYVLCVASSSGKRRRADVRCNARDLGRRQTFCAIPTNHPPI
ncbi:MAG: alkaline phosphatase family protein [Planctomycetales bacterium]|nr:alkaline phosphatase family protein [Planctomycetales bacterium]